MHNKYVERFKFELPAPRLTNDKNVLSRLRKRGNPLTAKCSYTAKAKKRDGCYEQSIDFKITIGISPLSDSVTSPWATSCHFYRFWG